MRSIFFSSDYSTGIAIVLQKSREEIGDSLLRHIGIYAYRAGFIRRYVSWAPSPLEQIEMLEQLRVLWYGEKNPRRGGGSGSAPALIRRKIWSASAPSCVNPCRPLRLKGTYFCL